MRNTNTLDQETPCHNRAQRRAEARDARHGKQRDSEDHANDPLIDTEQLAAILQCTPQWIEKLRSEGRGPPFLKIGRLVRYRRNSVERWLDWCSRATEGPAAPP